MIRKKKDGEKIKAERIIGEFPTIIQVLIVLICSLEMLFLLIIFILVLARGTGLKLFLGATLSMAFSNVVAIIGVAVAVWAGLNISNTTQRNEIAEINEKAKESKNLVDEAKNYADIAKGYKEAAEAASQEFINLRGEVDKAEEKSAHANKMEFLVEVEKTSFYAFSKWLSNKIISTEDSVCSADTWKTLAVSEREIRFIDSWYRGNVVINESAIKVVIENAIESFNKIWETEENPPFAKAYAVVSLADIYYFEGWRFNNTETFSTSEAFKRCYDLCNEKTVLSMFNNLNAESLIDVDISKLDDMDKELYAYLCNIAGDALSEAKLNKLDEACRLCKNAVAVTQQTDVNLETYYRNLGCVTERKYTAKKKTISKRVFNEVLSYYDKAGKIRLKEKNLRCRMSLINKYLNSILELSNYVETSHFEKDKWDAIIRIVSKRKADILELNNQMDELAEVARVIFPESPWGFVYEAVALRNRILVELIDGVDKIAPETLAALDREIRMYKNRIPIMNGLILVTYNDLDVCQRYLHAK